MKEHKLRFGLAGPGTIGHFHARAIEQADGAELVAVLGRNSEKGSAFANQYGVQFYTEIEPFLKDSGLDALVIATPSGAHRDIAVSAARQGKHVLCEKPLEVTPERASAIVDACLENEVRLGIFFQSRLEESVLLAREAIADGRLGNIVLASCQMRWHRSQAYYDSAAWRGTWELDGGGCLMNQGIHTLDLLLHLAGDPSEVCAFKGPVTHQRIEVEDNISGTVRFSSSAVGTIEASTSCGPGYPRRIEISGDKGTICIEENRIVRWDFEKVLPGDAEVVGRFAPAARDKGGAGDPTAIDVSGHRLIVEDFVRSVYEGREPCVSGVEGKRAVDFICALYDSMGKGGIPVKIG